MNFEQEAIAVKRAVLEEVFRQTQGQLENARLNERTLQRVNIKSPNKDNELALGNLQRVIGELEEKIQVIKEEYENLPKVEEETKSE